MNPMLKPERMLLFKNIDNTMHSERSKYTRELARSFQEGAPTEGMKISAFRIAEMFELQLDLAEQRPIEVWKGKR